MKKFIICILFLSSFCFAQKDTTDRLELRNEKLYKGKVVVIRARTIDFRESSTDLLYEFEKKDIRYLKLSSGQVLTFENHYENPQTIQKEPVIIKADTGTDGGVTILAIVGAITLVGLLLAAIF